MGLMMGLMRTHGIGWMRTHAIGFHNPVRRVQAGDVLLQGPDTVAFAPVGQQRVQLDHAVEEVRLRARRGEARVRRDVDKCKISPQPHHFGIVVEIGLPCE